MEARTDHRWLERWEHLLRETASNRPVLELACDRGNGYFDWDTTVAAIGGIRRVLAPGGLFLCRVNSVRDVLHGAGQGEEIEPGFYRQDAHYASFKRFFSDADLDRLFPAREWRELIREEVTIDRYAQPKVAWELALTPAQ